ncbi:unannotated protein [freshwater metagenome]|uniref:Unannotated protein n=1 Tax=freshwater metagenome TaxID=449393 RepID=A0A6J7BK80_9ZZZZ
MAQDAARRAVREPPDQCSGSPIVADHMALPDRVLGSAASSAIAAAQGIADVGHTAIATDEAVRRLSEIVCAYAHVGTIGIALWSESREYLQSLPGSFNATPSMAASSQIDADDRQSFAASVALTGIARFTNTPRETLSEVRDWLQAFEIENFLTVPLIADGDCIGVLQLANRPDGFTNEDVGVISPLCGFIAVTISQVLQRITLQRQEALSELIGAMAREVVSGSHLEELSTTLFADFCQAADTSMVVVTFHAGSFPPIIIRRHDLDADTERDFLEASKRPRKSAHTALTRPSRADDAGAFAIHAPIMVGGRAEGTISTLRVPGIPFSSMETKTILRLSNVMALAWATEHYQLQRARNDLMQERQRIADALHDEVAQYLFSGELTLQSMAYDLPPGSSLLPRIDHAQKMITQGQLALRDSIQELAQPVIHDISERLLTAAALVEHQFDIFVEVTVDPEVLASSRTLPAPSSNALVQVAREAMVNAAKHAGPCRITVDLTRQSDEALTLLVVDDGTGYLPDGKPGHGLESLRRNLAAVGGTLSISAGSESGTIYRAVIPVAGGHEPVVAGVDNHASTLSAVEETGRV